MPPAFWVVEPGDVGEWTSARNGYSAKQFRVDGLSDKANLDVLLTLTEVDPSDYDWNTGTDFTPVTGGGTISNPPTPQAIDSFDAQPYTLVDPDGIGRRPAILISWGVQPGISAIQYEVRLASDGSDVTRGRSDRPTAGNMIIPSASLLPNTAYQVRGQFVPSTPRDMLWSDWIDVTTPDVRFSLADFDAALTAQVTTIRDALQDQINFALNQIASIASDIAARAPLDQQELRSQLSARSDDALAQIDDVRTVAVTTEAAFASFETTATATWGSTTAFVNNSATAIATLNGYAAAQYAVTLNVNGYATGFNLLNGGPGFSTFTIVADKFQIQLPGYNSNSPVGVFTVGTINGVAAIGVNGANMFLDGTLHARAIVTGSITSASGAIGALGVNSLSIADNAVTVPATQTLTSNISPTPLSNLTQASIVTLSVDTTGLAGKTITVLASFSCAVAFTGSYYGNIDLRINGTSIFNYSFTSLPVPILNASGALAITATGGVMSIPVAVYLATDVDGLGNQATFQTRTLWATAAKR